MQLKVIELLLDWPLDISVVNLRPWLLKQLKTHGEPLRWAITAVQPPVPNHSHRQLRVEAVVIKT